MSRREASLRLEQAITDMRKAALCVGDPEAALVADRLLIEALRLCARLASRWRQADDLIEAYSDIKPEHKGATGGRRD